MGDAYSNEGSHHAQRLTLFNARCPASEVAWLGRIIPAKDGFKIEYKIGDGTYQQIDMVEPNITSYASNG